MPIMDSARFEELKSTGLLPGPSGVAMEILDLSQREETTVDDLTHVIQADPALAGRILKCANSASSGSRKKFSSLAEAVIRLGRRYISTVVLSFSVLSNSKNGPCCRFDYLKFSSGSLVLGLAAQTLTQKTKAFTPSDAFTCGMLSRTGQLGLANLFPEDYGSLLDVWDEGAPDELIRMEQEAFSTDHTQLTAMLFEDWGLPAYFSEAVLQQGMLGGRSADDASDAGRLLHDILQVASQMAAVCVADEHRRPRLLPELIERGKRLDLKPEQAIELCDQITADTAFMLYLCDQVVNQWHDWGEVIDVPTETIPPFADLFEMSVDLQPPPDDAEPDDPGQLEISKPKLIIEGIRPQHSNA